MREFVIKTVVSEFDSVDELPVNHAKLILRARDAAVAAYTPYSGFRVGTALLLESGRIITGNNQENAAYPSGNCAERIALFYANSQFPDEAVTAMAVSGMNKDGKMDGNPVYPCGACRQVILEAEIRYGVDIMLYFDGVSKIRSVKSVREILPLCFDQSALFKGGA